MAMKYRSKTHAAHDWKRDPAIAPYELEKTSKAALNKKRQSRIQATLSWIAVAFLRLWLMDQVILKASPLMTTLANQANLPRAQ